MAKRHPGLSERHRKIIGVPWQLPGFQWLLTFHSPDRRQHQRKIHLPDRLLSQPTAGDGVH